MHKEVVFNMKMGCSGYTEPTIDTGPDFSDSRAMDEYVVDWFHKRTAQGAFVVTFFFFEQKIMLYESPHAGFSLQDWRSTTSGGSRNSKQSMHYKREIFFMRVTFKGDYFLKNLSRTLIFSFDKYRQFFPLW